MEFKMYTDKRNADYEVCIETNNDNIRLITGLGNDETNALNDLFYKLSAYQHNIKKEIEYIDSIKLSMLNNADVLDIRYMSNK